MKNCYTLLLLLHFFTCAMGQVNEVKPHIIKPNGLLVDSTMTRQMKVLQKSVLPKLDLLVYRIPRLTMSELRAGKANKAKVVRVTDPGREGIFIYSPNSTATDDSALVVVSGTKRYERILHGYLNVKWFGATGNGVTNDYASFLAAYKAASIKKIDSINVPLTSKTYNIDVTDLLWNWDKFYGPGKLRYQGIIVSADGRKGQILSKKYTQIAHRGLANPFPENTMAAYQRAIAIGISVIEGDMHFTSDGHAVVIHDYDVNRTTNGSGGVRTKTLAEIKRLEAGKNNAASARIPTVREVIRFAKQKGVTFWLEIKKNSDFRSGDVALTNKLLQEEDPEGKVVWICSFSNEVLVEMRNLNAKVNLGWLGGSAATSDLHKAAFAGKGVVTLSMNQWSAGHGSIQRIKEAGLDVSAYTIPTTFAAKQYYDMGINNIITDIWAPLSPTEVVVRGTDLNISPTWSNSEWAQYNWNGESGITGNILKTKRSGKDTWVQTKVTLKPGETVVVEVEARALNGTKGVGMYISNTGGPYSNYINVDNSEFQKKILTYTCPLSSPTPVSATIGIGATSISKGWSADFMAEYRNPRVYIIGDLG